MMKLWYQSMSRQQAWGSYNKVLRGILDEIRKYYGDVYPTVKGKRK